jgi:osmotically inducible protein OsmC
MPRIAREAAVVWEGNLARGGGSLTAASSGAFSSLPYSLPTRVGNPEGKTSPEELLAAAHGGCFAMSLAGELTGAGTPPEQLDVRVTIVVDEVEGRHLVVLSQLDVTGRVPGGRGLHDVRARAGRGTDRDLGAAARVLATLARSTRKGERWRRRVEQR